MAGSGINSAIGNMVAQRKRVAAVRQSVGLEQTPQQRKAAATPQPWVDTFDYANHTPDQEVLDRMHQMASDYHYEQDAMQAPESPVTQPAPTEAPAPSKPNPSLDKAMAPLASYFQQNGRMPNAEELKQHMVKDQARQQLGREPTSDELAMFVAKPGV